jgi:hypothetical protein
MPVAWAALEIVEGPMLTMDPNGVTPLAGLIKVRTNIKSRAALEITDGIESWRVTFPAHDWEHHLPLLGLKPETAYDVDVIVSKGKHSIRVPLIAATGPLPADFPSLTIPVSDPSRMEPGLTLLDCFRRDSGDSRPRYTIVVDAAGDVRWYSTRCHDGGLQQVDSGDLLYRDDALIGEMDWLGADRFSVILADPGEGLHHELHPSAFGTYFSLSRVAVEVTDFPTSDTDPDAPTQTATLRDEPVVEFAADGTLVNQWLLTDLIDPRRIGYDSLNVPGGSSWHDWAHANAVFHDPTNDTLLVSVRHQDAIVKFSRETGELIWILAPHVNWAPEFEPFLLQPVGAPFEWSYHPHAPMLTDGGTLVLYDNGNLRASPFDGQPTVPNSENYSRAVEYAIDETAMEVQQVWEYGTRPAERLYTGFQGDADWLGTTGNVLTTFSSVSFVDGVESEVLGLGTLHARIVETDDATPAQKVFELWVVDPAGLRITIYRSERIPGLYGPDIVVEPLDPVAGTAGGKAPLGNR